MECPRRTRPRYDPVLQPLNQYFPTIPIFSTEPSAALFRDLCRADFSVYRDVYCEFSLSHCSKLLCRSRVGAWRETYGFDTLWYLTFLGLINSLWFICLFDMGFRLFSRLAYLLGGSCSNPQLVLCWCLKRPMGRHNVRIWRVSISKALKKNRKNYDFFLKLALHLIHSNSFSPQSIRVCKLDCATLI